MATATQEQKGGVIVLTLSGNIDDGDDFDKMIGAPSGVLQINCRNINRINSVGIKKWIKFFAALQQRKVTFSFEEFSPSLVENLNMVQNLNCGGPVNSLMIPYACSSCGQGCMGVMKCADIKAKNFAVPPVKCPKCGASAEFDDEPDEYFAFLQR